MAEEVMSLRTRRRFKEKYQRDQYTNCWIWTGTVNRGHGQMMVKGERYQAHRLSYATWVGPIPEDMYVHHECLNPLCVNPRHLRLMSAGDHKLWHLRESERR